VRGIELGYSARAIPKLNGVLIEGPLCLLEGRLIVWAIDDVCRAGNVPVIKKRIDAIIWHWRAPLTGTGGSTTELSVTDAWRRPLSVMALQ
jgi:hypothetical protein